jgi:predicted nicotinamide N-methyase
MNGLENIQFDMVLGSDLLYDFDYFVELVETLDKLYTHKKTEIIFCYTHRFTDVE